MLFFKFFMVSFLPTWPVWQHCAQPITTHQPKCGGFGGLMTISYICFGFQRVTVKHGGKPALRLCVDRYKKIAPIFFRSPTRCLIFQTFCTFWCCFLTWKCFVVWQWDFFPWIVFSRFDTYAVYDTFLSVDWFSGFWQSYLGWLKSAFWQWKPFETENKKSL